MIRIPPLKIWKSPRSCDKAALILIAPNGILSLIEGDLIVDMLDDAANLPKDFLDSALTTTSLLIAGSNEGLGDFDASEYVDDLRQTMNELVVGALLQNIPGEPGTEFNSGGLQVNSSKQTVDNIDKDTCGGGVFDFPAGIANGASTVNCGYTKQSDGSYEQATGEKMASEVTK